MERRREPRFECIQDAQLADLETGETYPATIVNISGRGMQILLDRAVPINTAIRVDYADHLLLGDVCYCLEDGGRFRAGIALAHSLTGIATLATLTRKLAAPASQSVPVP